MKYLKHKYKRGLSTALTLTLISAISGSVWLIGSKFAENESRISVVETALTSQTQIVAKQSAQVDKSLEDLNKKVDALLWDRGYNPAKVIKPIDQVQAKR